MALVFSGLTIPPAPSLNSAGKGAAERQITAAGSRSVVPLVYGRDRLGGLVLNVLPAAAGSSTLLVQVLWSFACDGLEDVRWSDQPLPAGATVTHYLGTQTTPDAALVAAFAAQSITYTSTLNGYCYSVFAIPVRLFSGELAFSATIRGERVYDPRQDSTNGGSGSQRLATPSTWTWSDNPALALADLLRDTTYGAGRTVNWASVITAANHCDALIGSPAEKRRTVGVSFATATELAAAVDSLRAYAGCFVLPGASGITLLPDQHGSPVATYSHASGEIASIEPLTLRDLRGVPTVVEVVYTDTSKLPWRDASATASLPGAGSTRPYRLQQLRMPGVQRYSQALREATERLNKLTLGDMATVVEVFDIGIRHEVGDIVSITHPVGISAKSFRVASPPEMVGLGRWRLPLVEHDSAFYSATVATAPTVPDTSLLNPAGPPPNVTGVTATVVPGAVVIAIPAKPVVDIEAIEIRRGTSWDTAVRLEDGAVGSTSVDGTRYVWSWPAIAAHTLLFRWRDRDGLLSPTPLSVAVTVTAQTLGIGAGQLIVNDLENLCTNGRGASTDGWSVNGAGSINAVPTAFPFWPASYGSQSALEMWARDHYFGQPIPVRAGDSFLLVWDSIPFGGQAMNFDCRLGFAFYNAAGSIIGWSNADGAVRPAAMSGAQRISGFITVPATLSGQTVAAVHQWVQIDKPSANGSNAFGDGIYATNIVVRRLVGTTLLQPNAATVVAVANVASQVVTTPVNFSRYPGTEATAVWTNPSTTDTATVVVQIGFEGVSAPTGGGINAISGFEAGVSLNGPGGNTTLFSRDLTEVYANGFTPAELLGNRPHIGVYQVPPLQQLRANARPYIRAGNAGGQFSCGPIASMIEVILR
jgi:hypothetical protein